MPSGFEVYDDSGRLQASDKTYDLSITSTHTINGKFPVRKSMVALESTQSGWAFLGLWRDIGEEDIENMAKGDGVVHVFEYKVVAGANFGLEVYDEQGGLTFSSNLKSCNVIDFVSIPNIFNSNVGDGLTFNKYYGNRRVAVIPVKLPYYAVRNPNNSINNSLATMGFNTADGSVKVGTVIDMEIFLPTSIAFQYPTELVFMVIDVTNY